MCFVKHIELRYDSLTYIYADSNESGQNHLVCLDLFCDTPYLQNEIDEPRLFYVFNLILSFCTCSQILKKICTW